MKKCGKKHIENRSGIACFGADYPFGPSGSFRDIVSVPELRPVRRTSGKRPSVSHALCCPHVVRPFADSPWGAFCCRSCAPNVREASLRLPCAVLPACRLRDVPPYAAPSFGSVLGAVLSRTAVNQKCSKPSKRRRCRSPRSSQTGPDCPSCEGVMRPTG